MIERTPGEEELDEKIKKFEQLVEEIAIGLRPKIESLLDQDGLRPDSTDYPQRPGNRPRNPRKPKTP